MEPPRINHYSRSLEKFGLKQKSWDSISSGNDSLGNTQGLSISHFLARQYGSSFDDSALAWSCLLRRQLANRTGIAHYLRPGDLWARNPEFGKLVLDQEKRGRRGNGLGKVIPPREWTRFPRGHTYQAARGSSAGVRKVPKQEARAARGPSQERGKRQSALVPALF